MKNNILLSLVLLILIVITLVSGCSEGTYTQTIVISIDTVNVNGHVSKVEYFRDRALINSLKFIDGDGDDIIDGKAGPSTAGNWPKGWEWFDEMYEDVIVGETTMTFSGEKIVIKNSKTHELLPGEYECEYVG
jgi:hypothetical protein